MTESEFLERIDRHSADANEHMARGNQLFDRCVRATDDLREFIREVTLRFERTHQATLDELAAGRRELLEQRHVLVDLREASRAQTEALMRMLERLEPRGES